MAISTIKQRILGVDYRGFFITLIDAAAYNTLPSLRAELKGRGEDFSKAELLHRAHGKYPNIVCYNTSPNSMPIHSIGYLLGVLNEVNDRLTLDDWKTQFTIDEINYSLINYAAKQKVLPQIFQPELWAGHVGEMRELWKLVLKSEKQQVDFKAVEQQAKKLSIPATTSSLWKKDADRKSIRGNIDGVNIEISFWSNDGSINTFDIQADNHPKAQPVMEKLLGALRKQGAEISDQRKYLSEGSGRVFSKNGELLYHSGNANPSWGARFHSQLSLEQIGAKTESLLDAPTAKAATRESGRTKPIILTTAHTGARYSPWQRKPDGKNVAIAPNFLAEHMPITPGQVIEDAYAAYEAGSRFIHIHARNPVTGVQHADPNWYREVAEKIRERCPGAILSFPTSRKGEVGIGIDEILSELPTARSRGTDIKRRAEVEMQIRASGLEAKPDTLTTFTVPEMKIFGETRDKKGVEDVPGWNDPDVMQAYFKQVNQRANELGVTQEIEITTMGEFDVLDQLAKRKDEFALKGPLHVVLILGFSNGLPIDRKTYEEALQRIDILREKTGFEITVSCGAVIRPLEAAEQQGPLAKDKHDYKEVMEWVAEDNRVDAFRVGLEDTPKLYGKSQTNAGLVAHAREFFEAKHIKVETAPSKVRKTFHRPRGMEFAKTTSEHVHVAEMFAEIPAMIGKLGGQLTKAHLNTKSGEGKIDFGMSENVHTISIKPHTKRQDAVILTIDSKSHILTDGTDIPNKLYNALQGEMTYPQRYKFKQHVRHAHTMGITT